MSDSEKMNQCFQWLNEQLFLIRNNIAGRIPPNNNFFVADILEHGLFGFDPEDIQEQLMYYIGRIESLSKDLPLILESIEFQEKKLPGEKVFEFVIITAQEQKDQLFADTQKELEFYQDELKKILTEIEDKMEGIGSSRFSNAGFKINLDMTVEEMACFFNTLYDSNIIIPVKEDGSKLHKKDLAKFIYSNFNSRKSKNISINYLVNHLKKHNLSEAKVEKIFKDLAKQISH